MPVYTNTVPATVRQGDTTNAASFLKSRLKRENYADVKVCQKAYKLAEDGICGPKTWGVLLNGGNTLVHYMQNDPRWGSALYTSTGNTSQTIANSACGPTSLAIAMSAYGQRAEPPELCKLAISGGHRTANSGTSWTFFAAVAPMFGCKAAQTGNISTAIAALTAGSVVVVSMAPGDYTKNGHYIVLRDFDAYSGLFYTVDPVSKLRNCCTRDVIEKQSKQFWIVTPVVTAPPPAKTPEEITVDNALADGIITNREHWLSVLRGTIPPNREYIKTMMDNAHSKIR